MVSSKNQKKLYFSFSSRHGSNVSTINNTALINLEAKITAIHYLASFLFMYLQTIEIMSHFIRKSLKNITMEECFLLCIHAHWITIAFENNKLYAQIYT